MTAARQFRTRFAWQWTTGYCTPVPIGAFFFELAGKFFGDGNALFGVADGGLEHIGELQGAVGFQSQGQAGDGAGHGDRAETDG